jgi:hypothetical protein
MIEPNSSITIAPHVEIAPAITQRRRDIPGLPLSLKIEEGVENMLLNFSNYQTNTTANLKVRYTQLRQSC